MIIVSVNVLELGNVFAWEVSTTEEKKLVCTFRIKDSCQYVHVYVWKVICLVLWWKARTSWWGRIPSTTKDGQEQIKKRTSWGKQQFIPLDIFYNMLFLWRGIRQQLVLKDEAGFPKWSMSSSPLFLAVLAVGTKPGLVFRGRGCQSHTRSVEREREREGERVQNVWLQTRTQHLRYSDHVCGLIVHCRQQRTCCVCYKRFATSTR